MKLPDWKTCVGYLVVLAALVLSLPGVQAVRADDAGVVISVNLVDSGSGCELGGGDSGTIRSAQVSLESHPDPSEGPDPIALNNQGYSYRSPGVDPEARQLEKR